MEQMSILLNTDMLPIHSFRLTPFEPAQGICIGGSCRCLGDGLRIRYSIQDWGNRILFQPWNSAPIRKDHLWEHTCFELFIRRIGEQAYEEYNFSPANTWNAFGFDSYRQNRREIVSTPPSIRMARSGDHFTLEATIDQIDTDDCQLGVSAILETIDAGRTFWALSHPGDKPDFHDIRSWR